MAKKQGKMEMVLAGYARNAHEKVPITFKWTESDNPVACFYGCTIEAPLNITVKGEEKTITKKMSIVAFGDCAEELADVEDGDWIEVLGNFQKKKGKDENYYDQVFVTEVIKA